MTQNKHIKLGCVNILEINRVTPPGIFLTAKDNEEVLLPNRYCTDEMQIHDLVKVFIYTDSEDRLVSSTLIPKVKLGEFGVFEVVDIAKIGAFVNWGLPKDLFVPRSFEHESFKIGDKKLLKIILDKKTNRLVATQKFSKYLSVNTKDLLVNSSVDILIYAKTKLGFKVIVQDKYQGLLFHNEIFESLHVGDFKKAFIKNIRDDGKLDISLQAIGDNKIYMTDKILNILKQNNDKMPYNYKSSAKEIAEIFSISKKTFKRTLTILQEKNLIVVKETGISKKG